MSTTDDYGLTDAEKEALAAALSSDDGEWHTVEFDDGTSMTICNPVGKPLMSTS